MFKSSSCSISHQYSMLSVFYFIPFSGCEISPCSLNFYFPDELWVWILFICSFMNCLFKTFAHLGEQRIFLLWICNCWFRFACFLKVPISLFTILARKNLSHCRLCVGVCFPGMRINTGLPWLPALASSSFSCASVQKPLPFPFPLQYCCLENSMERGAWWATVRAFARVGHNWATFISLSFIFLFSVLLPLKYIKWNNWSCENRERILRNFILEAVLVSVL